MKEELLDDGINIGEEEYLYLEELQHLSSILNKLVIVLSIYVGLDIIGMAKTLMTANYQISFLYTVFRVIIDGILVFFIHALWLQKQEQAAAHKKQFEENESNFLVRTYNTWYMLGLVFVVLILRTVLFLVL